MTKIKKKNRGLFEYQERIEKITKSPMEKLSVLPWENFRTFLNETLEPKEQKAPGGASHYDYVFMFKILIFQRFYHLSDEQAEFRINDSLSIQRFLGITLSDPVPDQKKIWQFRERLTKTKAIEKLFVMFDEMLERKGIIGKKGMIMDASFVDVPKQRNDRDDNSQIKEGKVPEKWKETPHKLSQKDTDARWAEKNKETHYGYKNHIKVDETTKLVRVYKVTSASVHDSQAVRDLLNEKDRGLAIYADSAYVGPEIENALNKYGVNSRIHERGYKNQPLTFNQKKNNRRKSKTRVRVEHVFGFQVNSMNGDFIRTIGIERAVGVIGLANLVYNMFRFCFICKGMSPAHP